MAFRYEFLVPLSSLGTILPAAGGGSDAARLTGDILASAGGKASVVARTDALEIKWTPAGEAHPLDVAVAALERVTTGKACSFFAFLRAAHHEIQPSFTTSAWH